MHGSATGLGPCPDEPLSERLGGCADGLRQCVLLETGLDIVPMPAPVFPFQDYKTVSNHVPHNMVVLSKRSGLLEAWAARMSFAISQFRTSTLQLPNNVEFDVIGGTDPVASLIWAFHVGPIKGDLSHKLQEVA